MTKANPKWEPLWGWVGFQKSAPCTLARASPAVQPVPSTSASASRSSDPQKAWKAWLKKVGVADENSWVKLVTFLNFVQKPSNQAKRYVDGKSKRAWRLEPGKGRLPKAKQDWTYLKSSQGGGAGQGLLHGKVAFLKEVFMAYYKHQV